MEWLKRFPHLECLCFFVFARVCVCADVNYVCQSLVPAASERERDFVKSTRLGEIMATGRRSRSTRLLFSLLLGLSLVQLLARGHWSETLRQGALTRLDPRIQPQ